MSVTCVQPGGCAQTSQSFICRQLV